MDYGILGILVGVVLIDIPRVLKAKREMKSWKLILCCNNTDKRLEREVEFDMGNVNDNNNH